MCKLLGVILPVIYIFLSAHVLVLAASEWVAGEPEVHLVPGAGDLRPGDLWATAGAQGDVRGSHPEEQDHQLRAGVRQEMYL